MRRPPLILLGRLMRTTFSIEVLDKFCHMTSYLDRIPRYGRLYTLNTRSRANLLNRTLPARWTWQKRGRWGMNILGDMGLLWDYIDRNNPDFASGRYNGSQFIKSPRRQYNSPRWKIIVIKREAVDD
jgi:hypothetical protein